MLDQTDGLKDLQATGAPSRAPSQKGANRPRDWADGLRGLHRSAPGYLWQATQFIYENFASFVGKCLTAVVILVVLMIVYQGLTRHVTVIDTISVPKPLADRGYTQDVVAQRFRDAFLVHLAIRPWKRRLDQDVADFHLFRHTVFIPVFLVIIPQIVWRDLNSSL